MEVFSGREMCLKVIDRDNSIPTITQVHERDFVNMPTDTLPLHVETWVASTCMTGVAHNTCNVVSQEHVGIGDIVAYQGKPNLMPKLVDHVAAIPHVEIKCQVEESQHVKRT